MAPSKSEKIEKDITGIFTEYKSKLDEYNKESSFCTSCGKKIENSNIYCPRCGSKNVLNNKNTEIKNTEQNENHIPTQKKDKRGNKGILFFIITAVIYSFRFIPIDFGQGLGTIQEMHSFCQNSLIEIFGSLSTSGRDFCLQINILSILHYTLTAVFFIISISYLYNEKIKD